MKVSYSTYSDVGSRSINEDSIGAFSASNRECFVLCDGLGGHGKGDVASSITVMTVKSLFQKADKLQSFLADSFTASEEALLAEQRKTNEMHKIKTTAVILALDNKKAYAGHVGDSRLYVFYKKGTYIRTKDHSIPQMLVISGEIKENEIRNHPDRNILLRVLGVDWEEPMYELIKPIPLRKCRAFLLCSDGFWELIEEDEMCSLLQSSESSQEWLDRMVEIVKEKGKEKNMDNNSAIAVMID